jgi:uncharacterized protein YdhG (YjbR/CyaY superfamily)
MATDTAVEEYLAAAEPAAREQLEQLRRLVREVAPDATERISYQMPAFRFEDRILVWYAAFRDHVSLFPANAVVRERLGVEIEPYLSGKGTIRFALGQPLPEDLIRRVVQIRIDENRANRAARNSTRPSVRRPGAYG